VLAEYAKENNVKTSAKYVRDDFSAAKGTIDIGAAYKASREKYRN